MPESNQPRRPAPQVDPIFIWPTPEKADLVFYVDKDYRLGENEDTWSFGDSYSEDPLKFPNHKLVYISPQDDEHWSRWYYASDRINQDAYNWEHAQADIGGTRFNVIKRTYLFPRASYDPLVPAQGAAMPNEPVGKFPAGYVLAERQQLRTGEKEFDSLYIAEIRTYVSKVSILSNDFDELTGGNLPTSQTWYYATEVVPGTGGKTAAQLFAEPDNTYWGGQADSTVRTGKQLTAAWYLITESKMVAGTPDGSGVISLETYEDSENYYWPPVLKQLQLMAWELKDEDALRYFPRPEYYSDGYSGPCIASIERSWCKTPQAISNVVEIGARSISYSGPFFSVGIPPCLHGEVEIQQNTGTEDPDWAENTGSLRVYPATDITSLPATWLAADGQKPYRGGYLRTKVTVTNPITATVFPP